MLFRDVHSRSRAAYAVLRLAELEQKITAITLLRAISDLGLKEAKDAVESMSSSVIENALYPVQTINYGDIKPKRPDRDLVNALLKSGISSKTGIRAFIQGWDAALS